MLFWIIVLVVVIVVGVKALKNKFTEITEMGQQQRETMPQKPPEELVANSEVAALFAENICAMFNPGGEEYQWLMANSKERMVQLDFTKMGVLFTKIEVNQRRLKETNTYDVEKSGLGFGASGYQDLPNGKYVSAFRSFILNQIRTNCPNVTVDTQNYVKLKETAKKGW